MTGVCKEIFKAIHEGKWLSIEYKNVENRITKYWIGIKQLDPRQRRLIVDGLHLRDMCVQELKINIDSIIKASIVEGSYCEINRALTEDIRLHPITYAGLFDQIPNMKILNYLSECSRLDTVPFRSDYSLIHCLDQASFIDGVCSLNEQQFQQIVSSFQRQSTEKKEKLRLRQMGLNMISIPCKQGLYVLAYRKLYLDVKHRSLKADGTITFCREFTLSGEKVSIRQFLDPGDLYLLDEPTDYMEEIKDAITYCNPNLKGVDDMPYVIAVETNPIIDLDHEYSAILNMYAQDAVSAPIRAFFGEFLKRPTRRKQYPLALMNRKVNMDQLLAINNAMKFPLAYIQGPPGTGKTNTILNTLMTAFFNERTVLFASNNNHPIDEVFKKMRSLSYKNRPIPFPIVRLGNLDKVENALKDMRALYESTKNIKIYDSTLNKDRDEKVQRTARLSKLLAAYEEVLDLKDRKEVTQRLLEENSQLGFRYELSVHQMAAIDRRLRQIGEIRPEDALRLIENDEEEFLKYLFYTSAKYIKRLNEPKNKELLEIITANPEDEDRILRFHAYLEKPENVRLFLRIFPVIATTNIAAHRIGTPETYFDMVIMDEASQCNTATALVPIIRGESLMLVGDPQQLQPVIVMNPSDNAALRKKYAVSQEYDYIQNSVYKTFLACDPVSDEILLRYHYRCNKKIIEFNNKKYYNGKLEVLSSVGSAEPLIFADVKDSGASLRNTSPGEAAQILRYLQLHPDQDVGIITPFSNQRKLLVNVLKENGFGNTACGTVHAFQGDEKDVILFSLGLSDQTQSKTYDWLKNNRELINVATSRARQQLIVFGSDKNLQRLHGASEQDDLYELIDYIKTDGACKVTQRTAASRALGIKPYSTETEAAFMENLKHAIDNIGAVVSRYTVHKEVPVAQVFTDNPSYTDLFYTGRFDFVVYETGPGNMEYPVLAIELDGKEHYENEIVRERDRKKQQICKEHDFELIRVENTYARRYHYIKDILIRYFSNGKNK